MIPKSYSQGLPRAALSCKNPLPCENRLANHASSCALWTLDVVLGRAKNRKERPAGGAGLELTEAWLHWRHFGGRNPQGPHLRVKRRSRGGPSKIKKPCDRGSGGVSSCFERGRRGRGRPRSISPIWPASHRLGDGWNHGALAVESPGASRSQLLPYPGNL
jgi:hypothetical protein